MWPHRPRLLDTQFCWPQGDTTLLLFPLIFCLFGATTFLEMNSGQGVGGFTPLHPAPSRPHKSHSKLSPSTRASLTPACRTDRPEDRHTMSRSIQTQAACLLLLILASLASSSVLQRQVSLPWSPLGWPGPERGQLRTAGGTEHRESHLRCRNWGLWDCVMGAGGPDLVSPSSTLSSLMGIRL